MIAHLRNNNVGLLAAAVASGIALVTYCVISTKKDGDVHCVLKCMCGKVSAEIHSQRSTPSAACHCNDCINYVNWVKAPSQQVRPFLEYFFESIKVTDI
jgi:hypothetical protein